MHKKLPLILIFSKRERIRDILTVGLLQCDYQVLQADTAVIAMLKANQFVPALIIADISPHNIRDLLIINRLHQSERTSKIKFIAIVPTKLKQPLENHIAQSEIEGMHQILHLLEYPFNFSNILKEIENILQIKQSAGGSRQEAVDQIRHNFQLSKQLQDASIPVDRKLTKVAECIQKQWAFPFTVIKALDIIGSKDSCCSELARCISADPSASTSILKVANTVFYARRQSKISDLREAVVRLGFQQTRNLLSCLALIDLTRDIYGETGFTRSEFWLHSLSVALISEQLCQQCKYQRPELAFVAGLIHDIGKVPMDNLFEELFSHLLDETVSRIVPFNLIETETIGFNHAELGHYLTRQWNFPQSITNTILNHHRPQVICKCFPVSDRILQSAVYAANMISKSIQIGHSCDNVLREIPASMLRELKLVNGPSDRFLNTIIKRINLLAKYLNISIRNLRPTVSTQNASVGDILFVHGNHPGYHPLVSALTHQGYLVRPMPKTPEKVDPKVKVIISMPEPGNPLDVVLYEDEAKEDLNQRILKIFIIDVNLKKDNPNAFNGKDMVFIHQHNLDMGHVFHILDQFFGVVVVPEKVPELKEEPSDDLMADTDIEQ